MAGDDPKKPNAAEETKAEQESLDILKRLSETERIRLATMEAQHEAHKNMNEMGKDYNKLRLDAVKLDSQRKIALAEEALALAKILKDTDEITAATDRLNDAKKEGAKLDAEAEISARNQRNIAMRITALSGVGDSWKNTALGGFLNNPADAGAALADTLTVANLAGSSMMKVVQSTIALATAQDEALVRFSQNTGQAQRYGDELVQLEADMYTMGVTMEGASETMTALVENVYTLETMSKASRTELEQTTALLNKFGVSADITSENVNHLTKVMGFGATEATNFQTEMFLTAQSLGRPAKEMAQNFESSKKQMAKFGKASTGVFKKLYINAKKAGMEVEQLLNITEKFDTFDGAAESVGKLNAMLGGSFLNSMEMVTTTDPSERMKMLSDAVNQAGVSFDDMGYYQRKALTEAMGLSDVSELAQVMAGDFDNMAGGAQKSQAELLELAKQQKDFNSIKDEYTQIMRSFAASMLPVVKLLGQFMDIIGKFISISPAVPYLIFGISAAVLAFKLQLSLANVEMTKTKLLMMGKAGIVGAMVLLFAAFTQMETPGRILTLVLMGIGAAFLFMHASSMGIFTAISLVVTGILMLIYWLVEAQVGSSFVELLIMVGSIFVAMGVAIYMAAGAAPVLAFGLLAIAAALVVLGLGVLTMWAISKGLSWIADSVERMDVSKLSALTDLFTALSLVTGEAADNIARMGAGIYAMGAGFTMMAVNPLALAMAPAIMGGVAVGATAAGAKGAGGKAAKPKPQKLEVTLMMDSVKMGNWAGEIADGRIKKAGNING